MADVTANEQDLISRKYVIAILESTVKATWDIWQRDPSDYWTNRIKGLESAIYIVRNLP